MFLLSVEGEKFLVSDKFLLSWTCGYFFSIQKKNPSAADLDYARSSLVMMEPDVFTDEGKPESDDNNAAEIEPAGCF